MNIILSLTVLLSLNLFAATERVTYSGSRSSQQINLEEDYYQTYQYSETVPVVRTVCSEIPVTQNYCEWVPGQRICQTRPICHPTPYGPRCVPTYGCFDTPARQFCRPVTSIQRQCGNRTFYEQVTRTGRRFQYRSKADVRFEFSEIPREFSLIEFDVNLDNDQLSLVSQDTGGPVIISTLMESRNLGRGQHFRKYQISSLTRERYLSPVSEIPELVNYNEINGLTFIIGKTETLTDIEIQLTLKSRYHQYEKTLIVRGARIVEQDDKTSLNVNLGEELGYDWPNWRNQTHVIDIKIMRRTSGQVINLDLRDGAYINSRFFL